MRFCLESAVIFFVYRLGLRLELWDSDSLKEFGVFCLGLVVLLLVSRLSVRVGEEYERLRALKG